MASQNPHSNTLYPLPSTKPYIPPTQHSRVINNLLARHQVRQIQNGLQLFRCSEDPEEGRQSEQLCAGMCAPVVAVEPSEAIRAKAHMMLATLGGDGPSAERDRRYHAAEALKCWRAVILRSGTSRFGIDEAKKELEVAKEIAMGLLG